ncbi:MAG: hypothetical protein HQ552_03420 [Desulfobacteraceae bacterium]|nr:hypothetical protein [Desulfobacteraceae bacterium]
MTKKIIILLLVLFTLDVMKENVQFTCGANIYYGATGTEYGGFKIPTTTFLSKPPDNAFLWLTFFF